MRVLLAILLFIPVVSHAQRLPPSDAPPSIQVSGFGNALAEPTRAVVSFAIEGREDEAAEAFDEVAAQAQRVLTTLRRLRLGRDQIQLSVLTVAPDGRRRGDYLAQRQVSVRVDTLSKLPAVLAALLDADVERVYGLSYDVDDLDALREDALDQAMANARITAERLAQSAGGTLGSALHIQASTRQDVEPVRYFRTFRETGYDDLMVRGVGAGTPGSYAFGTVGVSVSVQVTFRLDPSGLPAAPE
ncbi:MAG: SIMPL domain-containing protein [Bacteroidota bacterium]